MNKDENVLSVDFSKENNNLSEDQFLKFDNFVKKEMVSIILDARCENVLVPEKFSKKHDLCLNFSYKFGLRDFTYSAAGVQATLSFPEGYFFCKIPWRAVFLMHTHTSKKDFTWDQNLPGELKSKGQIKCKKKNTKLEII